MKPLRPHGHRFLLFVLLLLSSPAWAESYGDNMRLEEYIVGLAALALVIWDITRRHMPSSVEGESASGPAASGSICAKLRDLEAWTRIREVALDHPFEASVVACSFALLVFTRVPFSLSAALVGVVTWYSLVLGARLASQPVSVKPAAIVAHPAPSTEADGRRGSGASSSRRRAPAKAKA